MLIGGVGIVLVVALFAGAFVLRQRQPAAQASAPAGVCAPMDSDAVGIILPGVTLPVTLPAGEPRVVATVNGDPLYAEGLELKVAGVLANHQQMLQQGPPGSLPPGSLPPGSLPPNLQAIVNETPNQIRHNALTQMIQDCLLVQDGKRLGLTASLSAAQAMARQTLQFIRSLQASNPARVSFATYLRANHLNEQTFLTDPRILRGYVNALTITAVKQRIVKGLPSGESPEAGINAYIQHLWQTGNVRVFLPAQLGW